MLLDLALIRHAPLPFDADARQSGSQQGESQ
jgi:hypothetical protein